MIIDGTFKCLIVKLHGGIKVVCKKSNGWEEYECQTDTDNCYEIASGVFFKVLPISEFAVVLEYAIGQGVIGLNWDMETEKI